LFSFSPPWERIAVGLTEFSTRLAAGFSGRDEGERGGFKIDILRFIRSRNGAKAAGGPLFSFWTAASVSTWRLKVSRCPQFRISCRNPTLGFDKWHLRAAALLAQEKKVSPAGGQGSPVLDLRDQD
jgi:hypothetical protein